MPVVRYDTRDVAKIWANVDDLIKDNNYNPYTSILEGIRNFIKW